MTAPSRPRQSSAALRTSSHGWPVDVAAAPTEIRIALLCGSTRSPSHTRALTKCVEQALIELGAATTLWDLRAVDLPIADPEFHDAPECHPSPVVRRLVGVADTHDAFVLATPVYHNSFSGVLKNALDSLSIAQFHYKPVGLIGHGTDRTTQAVDHLRQVVRGLLGIAIPTQVCTASSDYRELESGGYDVASSDVRERVQRFSSELTIFAHQFRLLRRMAVSAHSGASASPVPRTTRDSEIRDSDALSAAAVLVSHT